VTTPRDGGRVVIVGGGLAGYSAALQLRVLGHDGTITIIDREPAVYDRPPLSKRLFDDDFSIEALTFATAEKLASERITILVGHTVTAIDPDAASVTLDDGRGFPADTILLTTGGRARALFIPGANSPRVRVLRTYADAIAIRESTHPGSRIVVIGAGLIGAELASSLHKAGAIVTLVDPVTVPLVPAVGELMAEYLHSMHVENGLSVVVGITERIESLDGHLVVAVDGGPKIDADLVIVGVGIVPNTELAVAAGLEVDNGVLIDHSHHTSAEKVFAAGDVSRRRDDDGVMYRREEHWDAAQLGGQRAAYGMLGMDIPTGGASWFWSDRHGIHLEVAGRMTGPGDTITRANGSHPTVFLVDKGFLVGAATIDDINTVRAARRLIDKRVPVTAEDLADASVPLRSLLKAAR
jgi:3-phenylpropionate/trans-cinnamate dioxygenase ferredoxin reductase subunit